MYVITQLIDRDWIYKCVVRTHNTYATCFLHPSTRGISEPGTTGKSRGLALAGEAPGASGAYLTAREPQHIW